MLGFCSIGKRSSLFCRWCSFGLYGYQNDGVYWLSRAKRPLLHVPFTWPVREMRAGLSNRIQMSQTCSRTSTFAYCCHCPLLLPFRAL